MPALKRLPVLMVAGSALLATACTHAPKARFGLAEPAPVRTDAARAAPAVAERGSAVAASSAMPVSGPGVVPGGFVRLCLRSPEDCARGTSGAEREAVRARALTIHERRWPGALALAQGAAAFRGGVEADAAPASVLAGVAASDPVASDDLRPATAGGTLVMNAATYALLDAVNRRVNGAVRQLSDPQAFGVDDYWTAPLSSGLSAGDCEDFALEKRRALIRRGVPAEALSVAIGTTAKGEIHAVLVASTDRGDYVLDNLQARVLPWRALGYRWITRQSAEDPLVWSAVVAQTA